MENRVISKSRSILKLNSAEARRFLLKADSYCNFELPIYIVFDKLLEELDQCLSGKSLIKSKINLTILQIPGICKFGYNGLQSNLIRRTITKKLFARRWPEVLPRYGTPMAFINHRWNDASGKIIDQERIEMLPPVISNSEVELFTSNFILLKILSK
jgi:hypothetical protein